MKLSLALSACWVLALVSAMDTPKPCTAPDLFEGHWTIMYPTRFLSDYGTFSYDAIHQRFYINMLLFGGDKPVRKVDILLYNESVMYTFFPENKTCVKLPLRTPFEPFGVPKNAIFIGQIYIGSSSIPEAGLLINTWNVNQKGVKKIMTFTDYGCYPQYRMIDQVDSWFVDSFYNLTTGIQDPTVFIPPPECEEQL